jgi:hypothetical protein
MTVEHINNVTQESIAPIIDELILRSYIYNRRQKYE